MAIQVTKKNGIQQDGNIINQLLFRYWPYWPLFLIMLILGGVVAFAYIRYTTPIFEASASIMIKDERKGADQSKVLESLNLFGAKKIVENEIEMIQSRTLLRNVVEKLRLYAPVYAEGKVNVIHAYTQSPVELEVKHLDSLVEAEKIYFSYDKNNQVVNIQGKDYPLNQWESSPWGTIRFVPNANYQQPAVEKPLFFALVQPKKVIDYLGKQLSIATSGKQSTVIVIKVHDPVPVRGKLVVKELIHQYDLAAVNDKNQLARNTLAYVEDRLDNMLRDLDSTDRSIQEFRTANNLVDIGAQGQQFLQSVGTSDQRVSEIEIQLAALKEVENYVRTSDKNAGMVPSTLGINDPMLANLLSQLYEAQMQLERLRSTTGENNPVIVSLKEQIGRIRPSILDNIESQKRNLQGSRSSFSTNTNRYSSLLRSMPEKERQLMEISRERSIKAANYQALLQQKEETEMSLNATVSDSRVVDEPESSGKPVSPNIKFIYLLFTLGGLGLAVLFITLKEGMNRTILFRNEIENYTKVPVIGEVIQDTSGEQIVIANDKKNFIAEQFRQIRTSLSYLGIGPRKKKVLITSSIPGEGKSFVAANLAISLSLTDKKVVVMEVDLRKPKLSEIFDIRSSTVGISNYLIGEKEADEIIKRTDINPNLFIISAGPIPPNPSELILNGRIQELLAYLENVFDYIVIDTAPVSPVTDAYLLSQFCDATLYVVRHGYTPRIYLQLLDENNRVRSLKNLALIFNGVKSRGIGKGGYGNGYGYGYGVGYGDEDVRGKVKKVRSIFGKAKAYR